MRVLTWNIRKCKGGYRGAVHPESLAESLAARHPDLVLCQEVFHDALDSGHAQSEMIAGGLDMARVYGPNAIYSRGHHGNATMTPHEILDSSNHDLSTNPIERRGVLHAEVAVNGRSVHVFNTHLGLNRGQRRKQVERIAAFIAETCRLDEAVILAGDFNDWTGRLDPYVRALTGFESAILDMKRNHRRSWPSPRPVFALDRIYYRGLELEDVHIHRDPPWDKLSDHLPMEATFRFR